MEKQMRIPQPKTYGPLGNVPLLDKDEPTLSLCKLADRYGPIFRMEFYGGFSQIVLSGEEWVKEVCDDSKFDKSLAGGLHFVRAFAGDGLFTGKTQEPNWQKAHNILIPSFSQQAMKGYHSMMVDIALQLVQKWARLGQNESIDVPDNMTRLTLDTIGLCGFNYRFNSFYQEEHNPFIISMVNALDEAMHQSTRLPIQNKLYISKKKQFEQDIQAMFSLVDKLIAERREQGDQGETDLLARMLTAKDPQTGEQLDDENIRFQIITFLIAGHETTSGLLSFALYLMLKHPEVMKKAYAEVDQVLTSPIPTYKQVTQLKYIRQILNESLRLYPTAPQFTLYAKEDMVLGGKYPIEKRQNVVVLLPQLHRDKNAWGEDAEEFKPERFDNPKNIPHDAYKPFGNGQRACIGMQFALHEATLVLGMILQHFELVDHENYELKIKQTLTLKPDNFKLRVKLRNKKILDPFSLTTEAKRTKQLDKKGAGKLLGVDNKPLLVLYGSNMGTAEGVARDLGDLANAYGVKTEVGTLDDYIGRLPKEGAVIIVTSSYNGKPPKNARKFVKWLDTVQYGELKGVNYAVFGCGDRNWASTYQNVPSMIDEQLEQKGATRFSQRGEADASGEFEKQLEQWKKELLSNALKAFGLKFEGSSEQKQASNGLGMQFVTGTELSLEYNDRISEGFVDATKLSIPEEVAFKEGDKLGVFPSNEAEIVDRVLKRFKLNAHDIVVLKNTESTTYLPINRPISLDHLLQNWLDLTQPATAEQVKELAAITVCPPHRFELEAMAEEGVYEKRILETKITVLDLLEKYEACELSFERFIEMLPPLKPKFYSISSSIEKKENNRMSV
ncbi:cytochrome P450 [Mesobacillus maritimus]|uniref:cytochrome P450 n=1 Tax=Mesobacillus maritimus TaxID=1643336 RepID=UPI002559701E|nr:cytochrome P450 [Mesobacillus maritimus]